MATFALSRREPAYVGRAKAVQVLESDRAAGRIAPEVAAAAKAAGISDAMLHDATIGSVVFANKPGDGSAREQAASCQRVLGGGANICYEYATKRYRSNCINWGMMPFHIDPETAFDYQPGDWVWVPEIRKAIETGADRVAALVITDNGVTPISLRLPPLTEDERAILLAGCLMNWYAEQNQ